MSTVSTDTPVLKHLPSDFLVHALSPGETLDHEVEGVGFTYVRTAAQAHRTLAASADLPYRRYTFGEHEVTHQESTRPAVIQTQMACRPWGPDEFHPGRAAVEMRFFLPSGCYATTAVRQLFARNDLTEPN